MKGWNGEEVEREGNEMKRNNVTRMILGNI